VRPTARHDADAMKKLALNLLKFSVSLALVAYLVVGVQRNDPATFERLRDDPKNWPLLAGALSCLVAALMLGWTRWCLLGRVLGLRVRLRDAFRLGFFGYMLDFLALGTAGGDLGKAYLLGREQSGRWAEALASVAIDRLIGLFSLSSIASIGVLVAARDTFTPELRAVAQLILLGAIGAVAGVVMLFTPRVQQLVAALLPRISTRLDRALHSMVGAMRMYGNRRRVLALIVLLSLGVPCLNVSGFYLIARALPFPAPSYSEHFVIIPPALVSGVVPLPMEALGVFEYALSYLYQQANAGAGVTAPVGAGLLVALTYRVLTIAVIVVGAPFYVGARREMAEAMRAGASDPTVATPNDAD